LTGTAGTNENFLKNSELLQKTNKVDTNEEDAMHKIQKTSSSMNMHQYHNESDAILHFSDESEDDNAAQPPQIFSKNRPCISSIIITRKSASVKPLNPSVDQLSPVHEQKNEYFKMPYGLDLIKDVEGKNYIKWPLKCSLILLTKQDLIENVNSKKNLREVNKIQLKFFSYRKRLLNGTGLHIDIEPSLITRALPLILAPRCLCYSQCIKVLFCLNWL